MLTQTLRELERDGLVARELVSDRPIHVEYSLTALGQELYDVLLPLLDWAEARMKRIERQRARFDRTTG